MNHIVYYPDGEITLDKFKVITSLDELLEFIKFNKVSFLSIPGTNESYEILDCIRVNNLQIKTVHIQQNYKNFVNRLRMFFELAKIYQENEIKNSIILKHEYLDGIIEKNNKKD